MSPTNDPVIWCFCRRIAAYAFATDPFGPRSARPGPQIAVWGRGGGGLGPGARDSPPHQLTKVEVSMQCTPESNATIVTPKNTSKNACCSSVLYLRGGRGGGGGGDG